MITRKAALIIPLIAVCMGSGCRQLVSVQAPPAGSEAWCKEVDDILAVSDPAGHGPDYASEEWCRAVHGSLSQELTPLGLDDAGSPEWYRQVDEAVFWLRRSKTEPTWEYAQSLRGISLKLEVWEPEGTTPVRRWHRLTAVAQGHEPIVIERRRGEQVLNQWLTDIDDDGLPEMILATRTFGSGAYGYVLLYEWTGQRFQQATDFEWRMPPDGYMGHDEITVANGMIIRTFPVYFEGDSNSQPTGGHIVQRWQYGEARLTMVDSHRQE